LFCGYVFLVRMKDQTSSGIQIPCLDGRGGKRLAARRFELLEPGAKLPRIFDALAPSPTLTCLLYLRNANNPARISTVWPDSPKNILPAPIYSSSVLQLKPQLNPIEMKRLTAHAFPKRVVNLPLASPLFS